MSELLPCPFCGGEARMTYDLMADGLGYNKIECRECGANTPGNYSKVGDQATWDWNTRYERTCHMIPFYREAGYKDFNAMWRCSECGNEVFAIPKYCPECGAKVVDA